MVEVKTIKVDPISNKNEKPSFLEEFYQLYCLVENRPRDHFLDGLLFAIKGTIESSQNPEDIREAIEKYKKICM